MKAASGDKRVDWSPVVASSPQANCILDKSNLSSYQGTLTRKSLAKTLAEPLVVINALTSSKIAFLFMSCLVVGTRGSGISFYGNRCL